MFVKFDTNRRYMVSKIIYIDDGATSDTAMLKLDNGETIKVKMSVDAVEKKIRKAVGG